ncbi:MAG: hypothetical protein ACI8P3_003754 [Saprospiraceae bacterium]|jgi:hypothetical protein
MEREQDKGVIEEFQSMSRMNIGKDFIFWTMLSRLLVIRKSFRMTNDHCQKVRACLEFSIRPANVIFSLILQLLLVHTKVCTEKRASSKQKTASFRLEAQTPNRLLISSFNPISFFLQTSVPFSTLHLVISK